MIDIKIVREHPQRLKASLKRRRMDDAVVDELAGLDESWRAKLTQVEILKAERNAASKAIAASQNAGEREEKIKAMRAVGGPAVPRVR